ncbi:MAG: Crp/Fnr family transcriptional regulator [Acholeplasmataceae bacterium]|nr:Crp/Fnr family transcriptional regulator [Acholeplasmataceae bacterium]
MKINLYEYDLFSKLNINKYGEIDKESQLLSVRKGEILHFEQDECIFLELIVSGKIHVEQIDDMGNTLVIRDYDKKSYIGMNMLFSSENKYMLSVVADVDTLIYRIPKHVIESLLNFASFRERFINLISDNSIFLGRHIKHQYRTSLRQKILKYLETESHFTQSNQVRLKSSKTYLSKQFGVERTSLSRELKKMNEEGLIEYDRLTITLINQNKSK